MKGQNRKHENETTDVCKYSVGGRRRNESRGGKRIGKSDACRVDLKRRARGGGPKETLVHSRRRDKAKRRGGGREMTARREKKQGNVMKERRRRETRDEAKKEKEIHEEIFQYELRRRGARREESVKR